MSARSIYAQIKKIEATMEGVLFQELNVGVSVTNRGEDEWTISGSDADARRAADYLVGKGLMKLESEPLYDEELDETFCYMSSKR